MRTVEASETANGAAVERALTGRHMAVEEPHRRGDDATAPDEMSGPAGVGTDPGGGRTTAAGTDR